MKISVSLPDGLMAVVDRERGDVSRSLWIRRQIESSGYTDSSGRDRVKAEREARAAEIIRGHPATVAERSPKVQQKPKGPREETELPKIARRHWA